MRFNLMSKAKTTYITELNDKPIQVDPIDNVTLVQVDDHIYTLPYGLKQFKQFAGQLEKNPETVQTLFESTIKPINTSRYGNDVNAFTSLAKSFLTNNEDAIVLVNVISNILVERNLPMINHKDLVDLINNAVQTGGLKVSKSEIKEISEIGRTASPEIHNDVIPVLIELIKQLDQQGILNDLDDIKAMMDAYKGR